MITTLMLLTCLTVQTQEDDWHDSESDGHAMTALGTQVDGPGAETGDLVRVRYFFQSVTTKQGPTAYFDVWDSFEKGISMGERGRRRSNERRGYTVVSVETKLSTGEPELDFDPVLQKAELRVNSGYYELYRYPDPPTQ